VTFLLEVEGTATKLTWVVESNEAGIVQLAEPLLSKQMNGMIRKSLARLKKYLQRKIL